MQAAACVNTGLVEVLSGSDYYIVALVAPLYETVVTSTYAHNRANR
jgi:hypothetical protein